MGIVLFAVLAGLEIALAVWTCTRENGKQTGRRNRLFLRALQTAAVVVALLLPLGQRWRFVPALGLLAVLLVIAALGMLRKSGGPRKPAGTILSCAACVLLFGLFLIPAFVFTGYRGLPVSGEYPVGEASAILIDRTRQDPFEEDGSSREVPVHFYYPEAGDSAAAFPLVVFSHGAFGYYQSNTSTYMELASNGYVVAALDHPHHAFFTEDTDGRLIPVDQGFLNAALSSSGEIVDEHPQEQLALFEDWMALRTGDIGHVLDALEGAARDGSLDDAWFLPEGGEDRILSMLGSLDLSRIGLMGHSMGGAASVAVGRMREDVAAVIDLDGTMLGEYTGVADGKLTVSEAPFEIPVLEFVNWETYNELADYMEEYRAEGGRYPNDELMRHAAAGFSTTIRGTRHMDFTDLPLLSPFLGNLLGSGERDTGETMTCVNSLVLQFFNCYLKGAGAFTVQDAY